MRLWKPPKYLGFLKLCFTKPCNYQRLCSCRDWGRDCSWDNPVLPVQVASTSTAGEPEDEEGGENRHACLVCPKRPVRVRYCPWVIMVHVLGNLTGLMEDLLKGDVNPDIFFLIAYPSSLTYLFLQQQELQCVHRTMGKSKGSAKPIVWRLVL